MQRRTSPIRPETDFSEADPAPVLFLLLVTLPWQSGSLIPLSGSINVWSLCEEDTGCGDRKNSETVYFGYKTSLVSLL
jgi:hypothetical protein